jgi:glucosamine-6-phosphate deaminase
MRNVETAPSVVPAGQPGPDTAAPEYNRLEFDEFSRLRPFRFTLVADRHELNRAIAREAVDLIKAANGRNQPTLIIVPVGPLDYSYWATLCNEENVSCAGLTTMCMDEYLDDSDHALAREHPLSFQGFVQRSLVDPLRPQLRPDPANVRCPDPRQPEAATALIESFGGADVCYGGMGITGHFAFNDPPEPGEPVVDDDVRGSRTRRLTITRESATQMAMGGVGGNWDILPRRAVTLGMYELLLSKRIHLTFMRAWHAGVLRRALFGPVTGRCPGSFIQEHPQVDVTITQLAARVPLCNVAQATGEGGET